MEPPKISVDVPAFMVRLALVALNAEPPELKEIVPEPILNALTDVLFAFKVDAFKLKLLQFNVPAVNTTEADEVRLLESDHSPPIPLNVRILAKLKPDAIVLPVVVERKLIFPVYVLVIPVDAVA